METPTGSAKKGKSKTKGKGTNSANNSSSTGTKMVEEAQTIAPLKIKITKKKKKKKVGVTHLCIIRFVLIDWGFAFALTYRESWTLIYMLGLCGNVESLNVNHIWP